MLLRNIWLGIILSLRWHTNENKQSTSTRADVSTKRHDGVKMLLLSKHASIFTSTLPNANARFQGCVHIRNLTEHGQITWNIGLKTCCCCWSNLKLTCLELFSRQDAVSTFLNLGFSMVLFYRIFISCLLIQLSLPKTYFSNLIGIFARETSHIPVMTISKNHVVAQLS